jgi:hypothetical protein
MNNTQIVGSAVIFGLLGKHMYHGAQIRQGMYKVDVKFVLMLETPLLFPNHHDDPSQKFLAHVKNQFTLWGVINMCKTKFSSHILTVVSLKTIIKIL